jgi:hypothetical protein
VDRRSNFVPQDSDWFGEGRSWRRDVACEQATDVRTIRARQSRIVVATMADRRIAGDELLIDRKCCVQTSDQRLQHEAARECVGDA